MEKLGVLESILKHTESSRGNSRSFNNLDELTEISEDRNVILQIKLEKGQENIKIKSKDEIRLEDCHSRAMSNGCDYKPPSYQTYNFALCLDRSDKIKHRDEELEPALSPKPSRHIRKLSEDIPIKKHSLSAPFNYSRTPSPRLRSRSNLSPSPRLSPFPSNRSNPRSLRASPVPSPRPSPQPSPLPIHRLSPHGCSHTSLETSPAPVRRISLTASPRLQNKIEKKNRRVGFSQNEDENEQNKNKEGTKKTVPVKQRKYSLPFFKNDKKEVEKPTHKKHTRSISTVEVPRQQNDFYLEYDVNTNRKKSCIALTNPALENKRTLKESVEECTNLVKAIEIAAYEIAERENKKKRKQSKHDLNNAVPDDSVKAALEEYKKSEIMISTDDRLDCRRRGIAERCELERELVKQSVKYLIQNEFITLYKD